MEEHPNDDRRVAASAGCLCQLLEQVNVASLRMMRSVLERLSRLIDQEQDASRARPFASATLAANSSTNRTTSLALVRSPRSAATAALASRADKLRLALPSPELLRRAGKRFEHDGFQRLSLARRQHGHEVRRFATPEEPPMEVGVDALQHRPGCAAMLGRVVKDVCEEDAKRGLPGTVRPGEAPGPASRALRAFAYPRQGSPHQGRDDVTVERTDAREVSLQMDRIDGSVAPGERTRATWLLPRAPPSRCRPRALGRPRSVVVPLEEAARIGLLVHQHLPQPGGVIKGHGAQGDLA